MLSTYHQKWADQRDEMIRHAVLVKELQLRNVFAEVAIPFATWSKVRLAVLGCKERRLALWQNEMLQRLVERPVQITIFDISVEHLTDVSGAVAHDATQPLPGGPFDLIYADVLVRFVPPEKQFSILQNAWEALTPGGFALIFFSREDVSPTPEYEPPSGTYRVDMPMLRNELLAHQISFLEIPVDVETTIPGDEETSIIDDVCLVIGR